MKILITGASGFVGSHLIDHLAATTSDKLFGTTRLLKDRSREGVHWYKINLTHPEDVQSMMDAVRPDRVYHLAGQAFVPASFENPWFTLENNIRGQVNLFQSILELKLECRVLVVGSAQVYGKILPEENPVKESQPFRPDSPYSVSKVTQDLLALQYFQTHELHTVRVRPFNHIGPDQDTRFALPNFAKQIAAIEANEQPPILRVGNLKAERDFTDVRDVVRAYHLLMEKGRAGEAYNVCRGEAHSIQSLLEMMSAMSKQPIKIQLDTDRLRPVDIPCMIGDPGKIRQDTGWEPEIAIDRSLTDILNFARAQHSHHHPKSEDASS